MDPQIVNVYDLPSARNVCNQLLREAVHHPQFSLAHVIMAPQGISLLHTHARMQEVYLVLKGGGILYVGDRVMEVQERAYARIPVNRAHKLHNVSPLNLEHLVVAVPPFDPQDVQLERDFGLKQSTERFVLNRSPIKALDGAWVYELLSDEECRDLGLSLAWGQLKGERKAVPHYHELSEEWYYIVSGRGKIKLGKSEQEVQQGSLIHIPKTVIHGLENRSSASLEVVCIACPPYIPSDFIPVKE